MYEFNIKTNFLFILAKKFKSIDLSTNRMRVIILAAGIGERLKPLTNNIPKPLIKIGGKSLIEHSLSNVSKCEIKEVVIVIGHFGDMIKQRIGNNFLGMKIEYIKNPIYNETKSLYSLWLAIKEIDDDFIFLDGDILYTHEMLKRLMESKHKDAILVSKLEQDTGEEVKVYVENGKVTKISKQRINEKLIGEAVGIVKISKENRKLLLEEIDKLSGKSKLNMEHEDSTQILCDKEIMNYVFVDKPWIEIDFIKDVKKAREVIYPLIKGFL